MRALIVAAGAAVLLSACSGRMERGPAMMSQPVAATPPAQDYVWARNDGRRMAENPELLRQGQADQSACRDSATMGGSLNMPAFQSCMEARGYSRRRTS